MHPPPPLQEGEEDWSTMDPESIAARRRKLFEMLKLKERKVKEQEAEMGEVKRELDRLKNGQLLTKVRGVEVLTFMCDQFFAL